MSDESPGGRPDDDAPGGHPAADERAADSAPDQRPDSTPGPGRRGDAARDRQTDVGSASGAEAMSGSAPDSERTPGTDGSLDAVSASGPDSAPVDSGAVPDAGAEPDAEPTVRLGTLTEDPATGRAREPYVPAADRQSGVAARRFWAGRRVPAAITAAAILAVAGLFLYDIAAVRADRDAMSWRTRLADELATRHLDNVWVIVGAAVAAVLGLWLILLALTPGERGLLPMIRGSHDGVRAGLDRRAAELVLRDRAMEVSGIRWVRVNVGRRRINARGTSHFRDLDDVRRDLTAALGDAVRQLGLAKPPQLHVTVARAEKKG